jgi:hypothetical protein
MSVAYAGMTRVTNLGGLGVVDLGDINPRLWLEVLWVICVEVSTRSRAK